jgi:hypothetical protein
MGLNTRATQDVKDAIWEGGGYLLFCWVIGVTTEKTRLQWGMMWIASHR